MRRPGACVPPPARYADVVRLLLAARRRNVVFAVVLAIASALAKEQGVTILAACAAEEAFALYDGAVRGRTPRHAAVLRCAAYASAAVAFLTARLALGGAPPPWTRHENPGAALVGDCKAPPDEDFDSQPGSPPRSRSGEAAPIRAT